MSMWFLAWHISWLSALVGMVHQLAWAENKSSSPDSRSIYQQCWEVLYKSPLPQPYGTGNWAFYGILLLVKSTHNANLGCVMIFGVFLSLLTREVAAIP